MKQIKQNSIIHGDCLEVMKNIKDKSIDMILCDLPYGVTGNKWDSVVSLNDLWVQYKRLVTDIGTIVLTGSQPFTTDLIISNREWFKYELIWFKSKGSNFFHANTQPLKTHENIIVFSKGGSTHNSKKIMTYNKQYTKGKPYYRGLIKNNNENIIGGMTKRATYMAKNVTGDRNPKSVIYYKTAESDKGDHPTQKPVALFEYLIKTYTNKGDIVLDNCAGSGTTGEACINTKRKFILIEKEKKYINVINKRLRGKL
jgi:site-specific DNA-methyltransferase (adenine-specific)